MNIDTYDKLLTMYLKQKANLATHRGAVGATETELDEVSQGADILQYLKDFSELTDTAKRAIFKIKGEVYNGDKDEPISTFAGFPAFAPPFPLISGLRERALERNKRYKAAAGYTKAIGIELGIEEESESIAPADVKPSAELSAASSEYLFAAVVSNRGKSDSWDVLFQRDGETGWAIAKTATGKSVDVTITPLNPGKPERIKVKIQLKKSNQKYGQESDIVEITINP